MMDHVIVTGSRVWPSATIISHVLFKLDPQLVIHGNARGADRFAEDWAKANERDYHGFNAKWKSYRSIGYDARAGHERNGRMLDAYPNALVIAFPYGLAAGTRNCISQALEKGHRVRVYDLKGEYQEADQAADELRSTQDIG